MRKHLSVVLIVSLLAGFVPAMVWNTSPVQAVFDVPYNPSSTAQSYQIGQELVDMRDQFTTVYYEGQGQYSADYSMESVHYEDAQGDWQEIDTTIMDAPARPNWDWEVVKGHWTLLIKDDTTIAVGKNGSWLGFQYAGYGYLDWGTKEYVVLGTPNAITPVVTENSITWNNLFGGVNLEYIYTPDGFKENLYITQTARDWLIANPPSSYGLNNADTYLVGGLECDWASAYPAEDVLGTSINWDNVNEFINDGVFWRNPTTQQLVQALPMGYALHDDVLPGDQTKLRYRFYESGGAHYLLFGAKVLDLNSYPAGTINLDPSVDVQVAAGADDAHEASGGVMNIAATALRLDAGATWYYGGFRWSSGSFPSQGDSITVCNVSVYVYSTTYDDISVEWLFEKAAAPATFSLTGYNITNRSMTTAKQLEQQIGIGTGWHMICGGNTTALVPILQEVVDSYSPTSIALISDPYGGDTRRFRPYSYDQSSSYGAQLHIEWTAGAVAEPPTVVTLAANETAATSTNMRGNITSINNTNISWRGFAWDTTSRSEPDEDTPPASSNYTYNWAQSGNYSTGVYNHTATGLTAATTYYYRAAANNTDDKWGWGDELSFLTLPAAPTNVAATDGTYTDYTEVTWNASAGNVTGYWLYVDGSPTTDMGNVTAYNYTSAAPTITPGTASASDGSSPLHVVLSVSGEVANNGTTNTYSLTAYNDAGNSTVSSNDTGFRGVGSITYQWYQSSGDADSDYSQVSGGTTDPYNDTTAPAPTITGGTAAASDGSSPLHVVLSLSGESGNNGAGRYWLCELSATGASSQNSTSNRGYRGTDTLSYQWYVSSGAPCSGFSQIGGGTTDPYNHTGAPAPSISANNATASDGSSPSHVTVSANETANNGDTRCYLCEVSMAGASSQNSTQNTGYRGTDTLTYQWYQSSGDAPSGWAQVAGGTTDPYDDTTAPAPTIDGGAANATDGTSPDYVTLSCNETATNGTGLYWLVEVSMTGATSQNTSNDRGYRGTTTLTYQWWRSSGDAPSGYSTIAGGTTDPYNDTGGVEDPDGRYYLVTNSMTGAVSQNSSADRGYEQAADEPTVVTLNASGITCSTATLWGNITDVTGGNATLRGFQYGTSTGNYTWATNETGNFGTGNYSLGVSSLSQNTTYYYRALAVNSEGTGYGNETSFITLEGTLPIVTSSAATIITSSGATFQGAITDTGCAGGTCSVRGFEWGTSTGNYTANWTQTDSYGTGDFNRAVTGLSANTTYYWRALATNPLGAGYSSERSFTTLEEEEAAAPTVLDMSALIDYLEDLIGGPLGIVNILFAIGLLACAIWKKGWIRVVLSLGVVIWGAFGTEYDLKVGLPLVAIGLVLFVLGILQLIRQHREAIAEAAED